MKNINKEARELARILVEDIEERKLGGIGRVG